MKLNELISNVIEGFLDSNTTQLLTEDQKKTIRNKIARAVAANLALDVNDEDVQRMTNEIWNSYVVHPIEGEKRQNNEITVINQNIERLIPYVIRYNRDGSERDGSEFYLNNSPRLHKSWENLIQAQRQNRQTKIWQDNEDLLHWNTKQAYNALSQQKEKEVAAQYNYSVYKVEDFNTPIEGLGVTVKELGSHTGGLGAVPLCYTQSYDTYSQYTNANRNNMYALLRDGWEKEPCEIGEDYPLDSYGLSIIFVIVSPNGSLEYNNVRWNHGPRGYSRNVDHIFSFNELHKIVGSNVIKQLNMSCNNNNNSIQLTYEVEQKLAQGEEFEDIFDKCVEILPTVCKVCYKGNYNAIDDELTLLSDIWFDWLDVINYGYRILAVKKDGKYNFMKTNGAFLWDKPVDEWFDNFPDEFREGFARIRIDTRRNLISLTGELLFPYDDIEKWPKRLGLFRNGVAAVKFDNGKRNYITKDRKYLWNKPMEEWFDFTDRIDDEYIYVEIDTSREYDSVCNIIRIDGTLVWDTENITEWLDFIDYDNIDNNFAVVTKNGESSYLNLIDGKLYKSKNKITEIRNIIRESVNKYLSENLLFKKYKK